MEAIEVYKKLLGEDEEFNQEDYLTLSGNGVFKVRINTSNTSQTTGYKYKYKIGNGSWTEATMKYNSNNVDNYVDVPANTKIYLKKESTGFSNATYQYNIQTSGAASLKIDVFGTLNSLNNSSDTLSVDIFSGLFRDNTHLQHASGLLFKSTTLANYCYANMFYKCSNLITAPAEFPATTLAKGCYSGMFADCTNLTTPPSILPATILAQQCYQSLFQNCSKLSSAPIIKAGNIGTDSCNSMFNSCSKLSTMPALTATTTIGTRGYYNMFGYCTSLNTVSELPATTISERSYERMFYGCSSLSSAPAISATTIAPSCCQYMFWGCKDLLSTPALPATTLAENCYSNMFNGCSKLSAINPNNLNKVTTLQPSCYMDMFAACLGLSSTPVDLFSQVQETASACCSSMFITCRSLTAIPNFPVTEATSEYCYGSMFEGCVTLSTATLLPATNLAPSCYQELFLGCNALTSISAYFPSWFDDDVSQPAVVEIPSSKFKWKDYDKKVMYFTFVSHGVNKIKIGDFAPWFYASNLDKIYAAINRADIWYSINGGEWQQYHDARYIAGNATYGADWLRDFKVQMNTKYNLTTKLSTNYIQGEVITLQNNDTLAIWNKTNWNDISEQDGCRGFKRIADGSSQNGFFDVIGDIRSLINWNGYNSNTGGGFTLVQNTYAGEFEGNNQYPSNNGYDMFKYTAFHNLLNGSLGRNLNPRYLKLLPGTTYLANGGEDSWINYAHTHSAKEYYETSAFVYTLMLENRKYASDYVPSSKYPIFGTGEAADRQLENFYNNLTGYADDEYYWAVDAVARYTQNWTYGIQTEGQFFKVDQLMEIYNGNGQSMEDQSRDLLQPITFENITTETDQKIIVANGYHFIPSTWIPKSELTEPEIRNGENNNLNISQVGYRNS